MIWEEGFLFYNAWVNNKFADLIFSFEPNFKGFNRRVYIEMKRAYDYNKLSECSFLIMLNRLCRYSGKEPNKMLDFFLEQ